MSMNVYELADGIESCTTDPLHRQAAAMLRSQEVEIERINAKHEEVVRQQQVEIKVLEEALGRALDMLGVPK